MKYIYLLLSIICVLPMQAQRLIGGAFAHHTLRYDDALPGRAIFYEGFENVLPPSLPAGWTTFGIESDQFRTGSAGSAPGQTNENGFWNVPQHGLFAMSNDDVCNCDKRQDVLTSKALNLEAYDRVLLQFSAYQDGSAGQEASIEIRTSQLPWISLGSITPSRSWKTHRISIPEAYLKDGFQMRFRYDDNGNYGTGLAVDDIYLIEDATDRFALESFYSINANEIGSGQLFDQIPENQARHARMHFGALVANDASDRKNGRLAVSVLGPLVYQDTSASWLLASHTSKVISLDARRRFTPYAKGDYDLSATLLTDSTDLDPEDNTFSGSFSVGDSIYRRTPMPSQLKAGVWLEQAGDRYGSVFHVFRSDTVEAAHIYIHPATEVGARFRVKVFPFDTLTSSSFSSAPIVIEEAHVGQMLRVPLDHRIPRGKQVLTIEKESGMGRLVIGASTDVEAHDQNALIRAAGQSWLGYPYFPLLELVMPSVDSTCSGHIQYEVKHESCPGSNDGGVFTEVIGANIPYTYNWSNGAGNVPDITNLSPGLYDLFVTDAENCIYEVNTEVKAADSIAINPVIMPDSCGKGIGSASLDVQGGQPPYSILWNGTTGVESATALSRGNYQISITDAHGCVGLDTVTVPGTDVIGIAFAVTNSGCLDSNGAVSITAFGTGPFNYVWHTGDTLDSITGLPSGIYAVTVTDSIGCQESGRAIVNDSGAAASSISQVEHIICEAMDQGAIDLSISGNPGPLSFAWSSGDTLEDLVDKAAGRYNVTITDSAGCRSFNTALIEDLSTPLLLDWNDRGNYCQGDSSGVIEAIVSGGAAPYSFQWSNGANSPSITDLPPGLYGVSVTDANQCLTSDSVTISAGTFFVAEIDSSFYDSTQNFIDDGQIYVSTHGGTPPISYLWNDSIPGKNLIGVPPGYYHLIATDQLGCMTDLSFLLENGPTGVPDQGKLVEVQYFPNPVSEGAKLTIQSSSTIRSIRWFGLLGNQLGHTVIPDPDALFTEVTTPLQASGMVLIEVTTEQGKSIERISILR